MVSIIRSFPFIEIDLALYFISFDCIINAEGVAVISLSSSVNLRSIFPSPVISDETHVGDEPSNLLPLITSLFVNLRASLPSGS